MAGLTNLETKLGEVIGLAMAAQASIDRVEKLAEGEREIVKQLKTMRQEAEAAEREGTEVAGTFPREEDEDPLGGSLRKEEGRGHAAHVPRPRRRPPRRPGVHDDG